MWRALPPILKQPTFRHLSRRPTFAQFPSPRLPCQASGCLTTGTDRSWSLRDLRGVSDETSPLIFHLTSDNPYHNQSIEHYLLTHSHPESRILLFYTNRPCVVIGRNQNPWLETDIKRLKQGVRPEHEDRPGDSPVTRGNAHATPVDLVRRRSGGGTVFHDSGNLNYSVIVPNNRSFTRAIHAEMVVRALSPMSSNYDFHDLRVNDRNDIVMRRGAGNQWLKVSGSAYKLTRGRALHHGTLLYSSPYINRISELLRSPGRESIQAKGVESVRSAVGNLMWTPDPVKRQTLKSEITEKIVQEFWRMYGGTTQRQVGWNEVTLGADECGEDKNPEIAAGVAELMSPAWRFEQTPRFDFSSGPLDGLEVALQANRGVLEHLVLNGRAGDVLLERRKEDLQQPVRLHDVRNWKGLITRKSVQDEDKDAAAVSAPPEDVQVSDALVDRIEAIFPRSE
ncbi:lipoate-protein ligase A [Exophiala viscosa]|uniref:lipoate-protein ligase A n=1 Tax=Exophiala viscosa TaxID=2486360 RepID=UPI00218F27EE|nr:lipoate-protein ligase A [Exophiala viscosa]